MRYEFLERDDSQARLRSASRLIRLLLQQDSEILRANRKELLRIALYKVTEAEAKDKCRPRYCTKAVWELPDVGTAKLIHEHVFQRANMASELMQSGPDLVDKILEKAVACAVTEREHEILNEYKKFDGWERYRRAQIEVVDVKQSYSGQIVFVPETLC